MILGSFEQSVLSVIPASLAQAAEQGGAALHSVVQSPKPLQLASFPMQLAAIGLVLVMSIVVDRFALRIGVPGALALFGTGMAIQPTHLSRLSESTFDHKSFESLHVIALCLLLFYSGVKLCRRYFSRQDYLIPSLLLSVLGALMVIVIGTGVMYFALGSIETRFSASAQPILIAMAMAYCIAPLDWGSFSFLVRRVERFSDHVSGVLEFETAISAAMTLIFGDALFEFFTDSGATTMLSRAVNIFVGSISEGIVIGGVLGYLLSIAIKRFAVERSQSIDLAIGFVMIGYGFNSWIGQGGLVCSLVMGLVVSVMLSSEESKDEKEMLSVQLESINIACESLIFFMAGLSVTLSHGLLQSLLAGIVLVSVVWILRPITISLFFRGSSFLNVGEHRFLSIWAPKGAISMALAITIPDLIEKSGIPYASVINPVSESFVIDAVCFAVVISMVLKSLILPSIHKWLMSDDQSGFA